MKRGPLIATFVLFIALCMSTAYWAVQLFKPPLRPVAAPLQEARHAPSMEAAAALFGGRPTIAIAGNFQLKGVVVAADAAESIAILAVGGHPAQAARANSEVAPGVTIKEIQPRYVLLSEGGMVKRVEMPENAKGQARVHVSADLPDIK